MGSYEDHVRDQQIERLAKDTPDPHYSNNGEIVRAALIVALDRIAALESRVAELEAVNDRRADYEAEQNERNG